GSFGCNLRCPFCQNYEISWSDEAARFAKTAESLQPEELVEIAEATKSRGNIGIAFTYNEPLIGYEFIRDTARLAKEKDLKTVIVTNGTAELTVLEELKPYIDAMNVDLKGFTDNYYKEILGGDRHQVMAFIEAAAAFCHVELTTLIVPGENDSEEEMRELSQWVAYLENQYKKKIPLHITRFFPMFKMTDKEPTAVSTVMKLAEVAKEKLEFVFPGNV
ncbi:MAG: radical SAM protein, partial [Treponema sp.]|nr:radical SAM protein [Treponema sp.]